MRKATSSEPVLSPGGILPSPGVPVRSRVQRSGSHRRMSHVPSRVISRRRAARNSPGFTLLEMVLSLTIVGLIVALVSAGFNLAGTAIGGGERAAEQNQRIRLAADIMMRQIKSAVLYAARDEDYEYPFFRGARRDLAFVTAAAQSGGGGLALVTYRVQGDPPQLILSETSVINRDVLGRQDELEQLPAREAVLLEGFTDVHFEYLMNDGIENEWFESWAGEEEEELPAAVRMVVEGLAGLGGGRWSQEIPLMIAAFGEVQPDLDEVVPDSDI